MKLSAIVAMDNNNAIGFNNQLLCHLPNDLKRFKQLTINKPIIMGYNTYLSIGKVLPNRRNIVLSRKHSLQNIEIYHDLETALNVLKETSEVMIIGGESLYQQTLPLVEILYITQINHSFRADSYFPVVNFNEWNCIKKEQNFADSHHFYDYCFSILIRR